MSNPTPPSEKERRRPVVVADGSTMDIAQVLREAVTADEVIASIRDCMRAVRPMSSARHGVHLVPDYTTRLAAISLLMAYQYGRPVERRMEARVPAQTAGGQVGGAGEPALDVSRVAQAPAAAEAIVEALLRSSPEARAAASRVLAAQPPAGLIVDAEPVPVPVPEPAPESCAKS